MVLSAPGAVASDAAPKREVSFEVGAEAVDFGDSFTFRAGSQSFLLGAGVGLSAGVRLNLSRHWSARLGGSIGWSDLASGSSTYVSLDGEFQYGWPGLAWHPYVAVGIGGVAVDSDAPEISTNRVLSLVTIRQRIGLRIPMRGRVTLMPALSHRFTGDFLVDNSVDSKGGTVDLSLLVGLSF